MIKEKTNEEKFKNLKKLNIIVFGITGLIVLGSWGMTIWTAFNILVAFPAMLLASCFCTWSYRNFIVNSLKKQQYRFESKAYWKDGGLFVKDKKEVK